MDIVKEEIKMERVIEVAKLAQIHDFITNEMLSGYDSEVGERGSRLSGGQRQRIGIARALYHGPKLLVLDEATSALDSKTETDFINAIEGLNGKMTIIMIAHRLTTLSSCDKIIELENGELENKNL